MVVADIGGEEGPAGGRGSERLSIRRPGGPRNDVRATGGTSTGSWRHENVHSEVGGPPFWSEAPENPSEGVVDIVGGGDLKKRGERKYFRGFG